jgi:hypothetical protein
MKYDFMKYWKVVKTFYTTKYNIKTPELEMLLFLYSEGPFKRADFIWFNNIMPWGVVTLKSLIARGYISCTHMKGKKGGYHQYEMTQSAKLMIATLYKHLTGEIIISTSKSNHEMFRKKDVPYTQKVLRNYIVNLNAELKGEKTKGKIYNFKKGVNYASVRKQQRQRQIPGLSSFVPPESTS